jgi:hypothetical protein
MRERSRWGTEAQGTHCREGEAPDSRDVPRASRIVEGTYGRHIEVTNRIHETSANCGAGPHYLKPAGQQSYAPLGVA